MISVKKDFQSVPYPLSKEHCKNGTQERTATTNEEKRKEVIENEEYNDNFNDRYKHKEIKEKLIDIYNGKCAFCEQKEQVMHVEHYRPKQKYYWLFASWDNLLLACSTCNGAGNKSTHFPIDGTKIAPPKTDCSDIDLSKINHFCKEYNKIEEPLLLNPEQEENIHFRFTFDRNGEITAKNSNDKQARETIKILGLNRNSLKIERKKIIDDFEDRMNDRTVKNKGDLKTQIIDEIRFLKKKANLKNSTENFLAFRNYVVNEGIMHQIIKNVLEKVR